MQKGNVRHLWEALVDEDMKRFDRWYLPSHRDLTYYCLGLVKEVDIAENVASDVLIKLFHLKDPESLESVENWLFMIARNACFSHISKEKRRREIRSHLQPVMRSESAPEAENTLMEQDVNKVMGEVLSENEREVWGLHASGYTNAEISEQTGTAEKTVANVKSLVRQKLKQALLA